MLALLCLSTGECLDFEVSPRAPFAPCQVSNSAAAPPRLIVAACLSALEAPHREAPPLNCIRSFLCLS